MATKKNAVKPVYTHIVWVDYDGTLNKYESLAEALEDVRSEADGYGESLEEYISNKGIEIFEVKQTLVVEEEVVRTIKINGEVVSL